MFQQLELGLAPRPRAGDPARYLRSLVESSEPLIYAYGLNPHVCFFRTHSSDDAGEKPITRKEFRSILNGKYRNHCYHFNAKNQRSEVYLRCQK